jgi:glycosyltransferase involved in cell wall biosynthesis
MAAASVFVATSAYSNRSIAVCEALVCGVPVVAFDSGETRAVVHDGQTGRLVQDGDVGALAEVVASLLAQDEVRTAMGSRARAFAREHFVDWRSRVGRESALVDRLAGGSAPGRR